MTDTPHAERGGNDLSDVLREAAAQLGDSLAAAPRRAGPHDNTLRLLDLRCKLVQLTVLPVLRDIVTDGEKAVEGTGRELAALRERLRKALDVPAGSAADRPAAAAALLIDEASRHFARIDRLLSDPQVAALLCDRGLADDIRAWAQRWSREIAGTGDIEDEERDPVGTPPR